MPGLAATGTLSYNGVEFTGADHITAETAAVYDDSGRTVKAHRITISVQTIITDSDGSSTDSTLETMRFLLGQAGKVLVFKNKGFGDDLVLNRGAKKDIDNGPKPEILSWVPVGNDLAADVNWRVTVMIPPCKYARYTGISTINWGATWAIDRHGDTTRTLSGFIEIAANGVGKQTADAYRKNFAPAPLRAFHREQTWTLSPDRRRVEFSIVDQQIASPNAYPQNMTGIEVKHQVGWRMGSAQPQNTISATIRPNSGWTGAEAYQVFINIVAQRRDWARRRGLSPIMTGLDIEEDMFGRPQSFRTTYWYTSDIPTLMTNLDKDAGLWRPLGTSWEKWVFSLSESTFRPDGRGNAGLLDIAANDAVVNLCTGERAISPNNLQTDVYGRRTSGTRPLTNEKPKPEHSYVDYNTAVAPTMEYPAVRQSTLQPTMDPEGGSVDINNPQDTGGPKFTHVGAKSGRTYYYDSDNPPPEQKTVGPIRDRIQVAGLARYGIRLMGSAIRAGYKIAVPKLTQVGDQVPTVKRQTFLQQSLGNVFGVEIFAARWSIDYLLDHAPGLVNPAPDPKNEPKSGTSFRSFNPPPLITTRATNR
jgi:hypothetical protein